VLILGAGASETSGYPLANELALLMCDERSFRDKLRRQFAEEGFYDENASYENAFASVQLESKAAATLRSSDFETMDQLSRHVAGGEHAHIARGLKILMRLVLAIHNPDKSHYGTSDYRKLVNRVLEGAHPRQDTTIISLNYDPYLEYRLFRAFRSRSVGTTGGEEAHHIAQAIHSGFLKPDDLRWLALDGFCHLKLHGVAALPAARHPGQLTVPVQPNQPTEFHAGYLFAGFDSRARLGTMVRGPHAEQAPPALLPWEIVHESGSRLLTELEFEATAGADWQHRPLYPLFAGIWQRARREIQAADKISLIGLSLGPYLEPGLKYLFEGKTGDVQLVVANPANKRFIERDDPLNRNGPAGHALEVLKEKCGMARRVSGSFREWDGDMAVEDFHTDSLMETVSCYNSFKEFIGAEM
jgi:hypothetical protein